MGYRMSKDGIERKTYSVKIRLSKDEVLDLKSMLDGTGCEPNESGLRDFLLVCIHDGILRLKDSVAEEITD